MKHFIPAIAILALCLALPLRATAQDHAASPTTPQPTQMAIYPHPVSVICADARGKAADKWIALKTGQSPWDACPGRRVSSILYNHFTRFPIMANIPPPHTQDDGGTH